MTTMSGMDITEFLLTRIAEDEREANVCLAQYRRAEGGSTPRWTRQLAECEAKRAIIEEHGPQEVASLDRDSWGKPFIVCRRCAIGDRQVIAPCHTLKSLATVYADHPDYREEWRP